MDREISQLICYALERGMIKEEDIDYSINLILDLLQLDDICFQRIEDHIPECTSILEKILDYAVLKNIIEDDITSRDLFDTRIMNCIMPRPSEVDRNFREKYKISPQDATNYYYQLSIDSQYIRKNRTDKNIRFQQYYKYGLIEITINLSKPEKDPKEIAKAKSIKSSGYPKCLLCKENVGFSGDLKRAARQTHRIIPVALENHQYYLQYSPYVYYNEHCIVFNELHTPMTINHQTFKHLFSFLDQFPHYMIGSNADLPIVGGSILTHDHYQGGCYTFPIEGAEIIKEISLSSFPHLKIEIVKWPLSTIRITSLDKNEIISFAGLVLEKWKKYENQLLDIIPFTNETPHNTVTPIARMKDNEYQLDIVLRNNRTSEEYPDGIFHPHQNLHHIKKENIGLIEVMGLAILPARLKTELQLLKECLLGNKKFDDYEILKKHKSWYDELRRNEIDESHIDDLLKLALTSRFVEVLEDAGVFKMNDEGIHAFIDFIENIEGGNKG
jgi:Galactose-1-phosphate uridyltransferase